MINIENLTIKEVKELVEVFSCLNGNKINNSQNIGINSQIGKKVIIRTYSAGVHYGELIEKVGAEVILKNSRRLWRWHTKKGVSLSEIANHGLFDSESKICEVVPEIWLQPIEIINCSEEAIYSIESQIAYINED